MTLITTLFVRNYFVFCACSSIYSVDLQIMKAQSLVDEVYSLPPLQKTPPTGSRSFSRHQLPNGFIVTYCDNLTHVPSVKKEFKPNPEVGVAMFKVENSGGIYCRTLIFVDDSSKI